MTSWRAESGMFADIHMTDSDIRPAEFGHGLLSIPRCDCCPVL